MIERFFFVLEPACAPYVQVRCGRVVRLPAAFSPTDSRKAGCVSLFFLMVAHRLSRMAVTTKVRAGYRDYNSKNSALKSRFYDDGSFRCIITQQRTFLSMLPHIAT